MSFFTITKPINDLMPFNMFTSRNMLTIFMEVNFARHIETGTFTRQTKQLSKRNVMIVLPPLRKIKYSELVNDIKGVARATTQMKRVASWRISPVVL